MPRAGLTTDVVVARAADLADEVGYERVTLAAVAEVFSVAVPSLYKHVGGLDDLRRRIAIRATRELGDAVVTASVDGDALRAMADAIRDFARAHPGRYAATVRAPDPGDTEHLEVTQAVLAAVLDVLRTRGIAGDDAVDAARAVRSAVHGFVALETAGGFGLARDVDRSYARMLDLLDAGLPTSPTS